ncbi:type IV secretory system conjugative DNA transfer family protein [Hellea sp.]|nr:type IV secretory system conjugative DNA transfer family protein [Hellea sp.]
MLLCILSCIYLTVSANWHLFLRWWAIGTARRKDRWQAVTTNPLIVRLRLSAHSQEGGTLLTMLGKHRFLRLPRRKLTYEDDRHVGVLGGTRGGKGTSIIVPNLLHHKGSVIVYDPAGENFALTAAYRQKVLGQTIVVLDPFSVTGQKSHAWNPLAEIDFEGDPQALDKCYALAESIIAVEGKDPYWSQSAQELLAMMCAYVGLRSIPENMHLPQIYDLLQSGELEPLWYAMSTCEGLNGILSRYGQAQGNRDNKEFAGVIQSLRTALRFMATQTMRNNLSTTDFTMRDLKDGKTTVYIVMPAGAGETYKGWLRLLFDCAFDAMQDNSIPSPKTPTLFLMDEFPLLGYMGRIKRAAGEAAKFGVKLFICAQDITQLKEIYGEAWETFIGNSGLTIMFANNDLATQNYLSAKLGKEYYKKITTSSGQSGSTSSTLELRSVARADEVARQTNRTSGSAYFLIPDMKPMRLPRAPYYAWDMIPKGLVYEPDKAIVKTTLEPLTPIAQAAE